MGTVPTARKSCNTRVSGAEKREQEAKEERRSARRRARITTWYSIELLDTRRNQLWMKASLIHTTPTGDGTAASRLYAKS